MNMTNIEQKTQDKYVEITQTYEKQLNEDIKPPITLHTSASFVGTVKCLECGREIDREKAYAELERGRFKRKLCSRTCYDNFMLRHHFIRRQVKIILS
jgi:hypothetical protein